MKYIEMRNMDEIVQLIVSTCVLHNLWILGDGTDVEGYIREGTELEVNAFGNILRPTGRGEDKRQQVIDMMGL